MASSFFVSTDKTKLDVQLIFDYLSNLSYWAEGRTLEVVKRSIDNSLNFGIFLRSDQEVEGRKEGDEQVGFARVVTDYATFAYLADVFVLEKYRGIGLSKLLLKEVVSHPLLQGLRRWSLVTKDAQELYARFGFQTLKTPERWMEIFNGTTPQ